MIKYIIAGVLLVGTGLTVTSKITTDARIAEENLFLNNKILERARKSAAKDIKDAESDVAVFQERSAAAVDSLDSIRLLMTSIDHQIVLVRAQAFQEAAANELIYVQDANLPYPEVPQAYAGLGVMVPCDQFTFVEGERRTKLHQYFLMTGTTWQARIDQLKQQKKDLDKVWINVWCERWNNLTIPEREARIASGDHVKGNITYDPTTKAVTPPEWAQ